LIHAAPDHRASDMPVQLYALPDLDDEGPINPLNFGIVR